MTHIEKQCRRLWYAVVHSRGPKACWVCGSTCNLEAHHLIPKARSKDPRIQYDADFGVLLCSTHHRGRLSAHKDPEWFLNEYFFKRFLPPAAAGNRAKKIVAVLKQKPIPPFRGKTDFKKIRARLLDQLGEAEECAWMNHDIEPEYGRI